MCIITDIFAHHVFNGSFFFIIPFSPTSIYHVVSYYHIRLSGHSVAVSFVSLVSSGPRVAAQLNSVLVSVFTASCVAARSTCVLVLDLIASQLTPWLSSFLFNYTASLLVSVFTALGFDTDVASYERGPIQSRALRFTTSLSRISRPSRRTPLYALRTSRSPIRRKDRRNITPCGAVLETGGWKLR